MLSLTPGRSIVTFGAFRGAFGDQFVIVEPLSAPYSVLAQCAFDSQPRETGGVTDVAQQACGSPLVLDVLGHRYVQSSYGPWGLVGERGFPICCVAVSIIATTLLTPGSRQPVLAQEPQPLCAAAPELRL